MDERSLLSDKQAITATDFSDSSLDLGQEGVIYDGTAITKRKGVAEHIPLYIGVNEDFDNLTSLNISVQQAAAVDGSGDLVAGEEVFAVEVLAADLLAGYICPIDKLPRKVTKRYLQFVYTVTGAAPTTGQISAGFVAAVDGGNKSGF
tara:strand:+ start:7828 stop:8271 length:444 start_codon:yes stop_codon:yes gene_type:complete